MTPGCLGHVAIPHALTIGRATTFQDHFWSLR